MKRFTATEKWDDPWFWELTPAAKLLWLFLCDHCDHAGIIEISFKFATMKIGLPINEKHLTELQSRLHGLPCGKFLIIGFIGFQYGTPSRDCKPHNPIFASLSKHNLDISQVETLSKGYSNPLVKGMDTPKDKDKDKDKDPSKETVQNAEVIPEALATDAFNEAWTRWHSHLKAKRKPATPHARELQLKSLSKIGEARAIAAINNSIEKNYQGIFEPSTANGNHQAARPPGGNF